MGVPTKIANECSYELATGISISCHQLHNRVADIPANPAASSTRLISIVELLRLYTEKLLITRQSLLQWHSLSHFSALAVIVWLHRSLRQRKSSGYTQPNKEEWILSLSVGVKLTCPRQTSYLSGETQRERRHISAGLTHKAEALSHSSLLRNEAMLPDCPRDGIEEKRRRRRVWGKGGGAENECVPESTVPIC